MAKRDDVIPERLLHHLQEVIPGFASEKLSDQRHLTKMIWQGRLKRRQHREFPGAIFFHHEELDAAFGRRKFQVINHRLGLFKVSSNWEAGIGSSARSRQTRAYWFSDVAENARRSFLTPHGPTLTRLRMMGGKVMSSLPKAVASKDSLGVTTTAWTNAASIGRVQVDLKMLRQLAHWLVGFRDHPIQRQDWRRGVDLSDSIDYPSQDLLQRLIDATSQILEMSQTDVAGAGVCPHWYVESQSGRLYATGINLQSSPSLVKQAALVGQWEYDFSNCHFSILTQLADRYGYQCKSITEYLNSKAETRRAISDQAGISVNDAKTCLLAILYGARATVWHENAIPEQIGTDAAARLYAVPLFTAIKTDVECARKAILSAFPRNRNGGLTNAFGKAIGKASSPAQQLAHLIQGIEAKALQAALIKYPYEIQLLQHDGFVSTARLDRTAIVDAVFDTTGYRLDLEEQQVRIDFGTQLLKDRFQLEKAVKPSVGAGLRLSPVS